MNEQKPTDADRKPYAILFVFVMTRARFAAGVVLWCLATSLVLPATLAQRQDNDLATASLEQLTQMQVSVSSFARKDEDVWKTPAAVFVITKEDIARSAVSSIPELLRIVPGMQVAQSTLPRGRSVPAVSTVYTPASCWC